MIQRPFAYAACAWSFIFAAASFYWALGGTLGGNTVGQGIAKLALEREPVFVTVLWTTALLKTGLGVVALALARDHAKLLTTLLRTAAWLAAGIFFIYGAANIVIFARMALGFAPIPAEIGSAALPWYLGMWEPWWVIGGVLFALAARDAGRPLRDPSGA